jgi:hypothetical protein
MPAPTPVPEPVVESSVEQTATEEHDDVDEPASIKEAIKKWKSLNPNDTIKNQRHMLARGEIQELPWMALAETLPELTTQHLFGTQLPKTGRKGDTYTRVDQIPTRLFKHNGTTWIELDKNISDSYTYDVAYIDFLIDQIARGEYDPDLLSESERDQVGLRLQQKEPE